MIQNSYLKVKTCSEFRRRVSLHDDDVFKLILQLKRRFLPATFAGIVSAVALQIVLKVELNLEVMLTVHYNLQAA